VDVRTARFAEEVLRTRSKFAAYTVLAHPGHDQKSHGRKGGGGRVEGKDLMRGGASAMAERVASARERYGSSRDPALSAIAAEQGFDGPPQVVSRQEMDRLVRGSPEIIRGVHSTDDKTAAEIHEEMRSGDAQFGRGVYGNGYYFAPPGGSGFAGAENFGDGTPGAIARATLSKDAKVVGYRQIHQEHDAYFASLGHEPYRPGGFEESPTGGWRESTPKSTEDLVFSDLGRFAAARGYDAIKMDDSKKGGYISPQYLVVNRTALIVEEAQ
jgi:hypothetical protein